jgi:hypothetical protein
VALTPLAVALEQPATAACTALAVAEVDLAFQPLMSLEAQPQAARALQSKRIAAQLHQLRAAAAQMAQ